MTENQKNKLEFKKVDNDKCQFISALPEVHRVETVNMDFVKRHIAELRKERKMYLGNLEKINEQLKDNKIEKDAEIEKFIELADKASGYKRYLDATKNRDGVLDILNKIDESIAAIENELPELKQ